MKRIILIVFLFAFLKQSYTQDIVVNAGVNCNCQTNYKQAVTESWDGYFMDISSPDRVMSLKSKISFGFNAGVNVNFRLNDKIAFQPGLHFNIKGAKAEGTYGSGGSSAPFTTQDILTYINAIAAFQYWVTNNLYVDLGPEFGLLAARKFKESDDGYPYESTDTENFNRFEVGVGGGAGYVFGSSGIGFFAKFTLGLTKLDTSEPYYDNVRNTARQFGFFYKIPRKK